MSPVKHNTDNYMRRLCTQLLATKRINVHILDLHDLLLVKGQILLSIICNDVFLPSFHIWRHRHHWLCRQILQH